MRRVVSARRIPLAEGPVIAAVIGKRLALLIQSAILEPINHFPVRQHRLMSQFSNDERTFDTGRQPHATPTAAAASPAIPDSKINRRCEKSGSPQANDTANQHDCIGSSRGGRYALSSQKVAKPAGSVLHLL